jgi:hypothetical protein
MKTKLKLIFSILFLLISTQVAATTIDFNRYANKDILDLRWILITNEDAPDLLAFLNNHPEITTLKIDLRPFDCHNKPQQQCMNTAAIKILAKNTTLTALELKGLHIPESEENEYGKALAENKTLQSLDLTWSQNGKAELAKSTTLKSLVLGTVWDGDKTAAAFADNKSLTSLAFETLDTPLTDKGAMLLAKMNKLTTLKLMFSKITDAGLTALAHNPQLTTLRVSANQSKFSQNAIKELANNNHLISLSLSDTGLSDEDAIILAQNNHLKELNLSYNNITDAGALEIAKNTSINKLNLGGSKLTEISAKALAKNTSLTSLTMDRLVDASNHNAIATALATSSSITNLDLDQLIIDDQAAIALANDTHLVKLVLTSSGKFTDTGALAFANNTTLKELDLYGSYLTSKSLMPLARNRTLTNLSVEFVNFGDGDPYPAPDIEWAKAFATNTTLKSLNLHCDRLGDQGAIDISKNTTLDFLEIDSSCNEISSAGVAALAANKIIKKIHTGF